MDQFIDNPEQNTQSAPVVPPAALPDKDAFTALNKKLQSGVALTTAESQQMKSLMAAGQGKPGDAAMDIPPATQADFDKAKAKFAATAGPQVPTPDSTGGGGEVLPGSPVPTSQVGVNPLLVGGAGQPPTPPNNPDNPSVRPPLAPPPAETPTGGQAPAPVPKKKGFLSALDTPVGNINASAPTEGMGKPSDSDSGSVSTEGDKAPYDLPGKVSTEGDVPAASTPSTTQLTTAAPKSFGQMVGTIAQKAGIGLLDVLQAFAHGKSGDTTPTRLGVQMNADIAAKAKAMEAEYMQNLQDSRQKLDQQGAKNLQDAQLLATKTGNEKNQAFEAAQNAAKLKVEQDIANGNIEKDKAVAEINKEASKHYWELLYGSTGMKKAGPTPEGLYNPGIPIAGGGQAAPAGMQVGPGTKSFLQQNPPQ